MKEGLNDQQLKEVVINEFIRTHMSSPLAIMANKLSSCTSCVLSNCRTNVVPFSGSFNPKVLIIGEAPGPDEDSLGIGFIGKAGDLLRTVLSKIGFKEQDVLFANSVACIPRDNVNAPFRAPKPNEIIACLPHLVDIYNTVGKNVSVAVLCGKSAFIAWRLAIIKANKPDTSNDDLLKLLASFSTLVMKSEIGPKVLPGTTFVSYTVYHPSFIERSGRNIEILQPWVDHFKAIKSIVENPSVNTEVKG